MRKDWGYYATLVEPAAARARAADGAVRERRRPRDGAGRGGRREAGVRAPTSTRSRCACSPGWTPTRRPPTPRAASRRREGAGPSSTRGWAPRGCPARSWATSPAARRWRGCSSAWGTRRARGRRARDVGRACRRPGRGVRRARGLAVHRGPLEDLAGRVLGAARPSGSTRWCGSTATRRCSTSGSSTAASRCCGRAAPTSSATFAPRSFPPGQSVEVLRTAALRAASRGWRTRTTAST